MHDNLERELHKHFSRQHVTHMRHCRNHASNSVSHHLVCPLPIRTIEFSITQKCRRNGITTEAAESPLFSGRIQSAFASRNRRCGFARPQDERCVSQTNLVQTQSSEIAPNRRKKLEVFDASNMTQHRHYRCEWNFATAAANSTCRYLRLLGGLAKPKETRDRFTR